MSEAGVPGKPHIAPELSGLPHVPVDALEPLQGELKTLSKREYNKLKKSLLEHGIIVPFFVWQESGKLLDGHQRQRVMINEGWLIDVPVVYISATDEQDAKRKLLVISSQYGRVSQEGWDAFTFDLDDGWLQETVHFDALPFVFGEWSSNMNDGVAFYPNTAPEYASRVVTADDIEKTQHKLDGRYSDAGREEYEEIPCPHCGKALYIKR